MDQSGASETAICIASAATKRQLVYLKGTTAKPRPLGGLLTVGEHPLGDYPTVGSNGLESRTTKSEFFWVYFGVFLALGFGGAERHKTLIINFIAKPTLRSAAAQRVPLNPSGLIER